VHAAITDAAAGVDAIDVDEDDDLSDGRGHRRTQSPRNPWRDTDDAARPNAAAVAAVAGAVVVKTGPGP